MEESSTSCGMFGRTVIIVYSTLPGLSILRLPFLAFDELCQIESVLRPHGTTSVLPITLLPNLLNKLITLLPCLTNKILKPGRDKMQLEEDKYPIVSIFQLSSRIGHCTKCLRYSYKITCKHANIYSLICNYLLLFTFLNKRRFINK
jgi:hypothetical protein